MITTKRYLELCEEEIKDYFCENYFSLNGYTIKDIKSEDLEVIQVWYCKTIQNHKGLFIVKQNETIYPYFIECTYNGDDKELYLDFYTKKFKHTERIE